MLRRETGAPRATIAAASVASSSMTGRRSTAATRSSSTSPDSCATPSPARWVSDPDDGSIAVDSSQATTVARVYAAGDRAHPRALVAAAGCSANAAVAIDARLSLEHADHVAQAAAPGGEVG